MLITPNFKKNHIVKQTIRFALINFFALFQTFVITISCKYILNIFFWNLGIVEFFAHILGVSFPVLTSYLAHKYFTFK